MLSGVQRVPVFQKKESEVDEPLVKLNTCLEEIVVNMILTTRTNPSLMALVNATKVCLRCDVLAVVLSAHP